MTTPNQPDIDHPGPMAREHGEDVPVPGLSPAVSQGVAPDWDSLRIRLFATRPLEGDSATAAEPATTADPGAPAADPAAAGVHRLRLCGSFDREAASTMTTYGTSSRSVNPSASTNLKRAGVRTTSDAGRHTTGGRGR